jgi:hypothetical protein
MLSEDDIVVLRGHSIDWFCMSAVSYRIAATSSGVVVLLPRIRSNSGRNCTPLADQ